LVWPSCVRMDVRVSVSVSLVFLVVPS